MSTLHWPTQVQLLVRLWYTLPLGFELATPYCTLASSLYLHVPNHLIHIVLCKSCSWCVMTICVLSYIQCTYTCTLDHTAFSTYMYMSTIMSWIARSALLRGSIVRLYRISSPITSVSNRWLYTTFSPLHLKKPKGKNVVYSHLLLTEVIRVLILFRIVLLLFCNLIGQ